MTGTALPPDKLAYSIEEACAATSLGTTKLYALMRQGKISAKAMGRRTVILRDSLERYLASLPDWSPNMGLGSGARKAGHAHRHGDH